LPTYAPYSDAPFFTHSKCGIQIYDLFQAYFGWLERDETLPNMLPFCILEEHKLVLVELGKLLLCKNWLKNEELISQLEAIRREASSLKFIMMKYAATGEKELIGKMASIIKEMRLVEERCLAELLETL
jgi:hypothetical protein